MKRSHGRKRLGLGQEPLVTQELTALGCKDQLDPFPELDARQPSTDPGELIRELTDDFHTGEFTRDVIDRLTELRTNDRLTQQFLDIMQGARVFLDRCFQPVWITVKPSPPHEPEL
jgi:hypothetical protein